MPYLVELKSGLLVEYREFDVRRAIVEISRGTNLAPEYLDELTNKVVSEVNKYVARKGTVKEEELENKILSVLDIFSPELLSAWLRYQKRSRGKILYK
jgi:hypothetical protein